MARSHGKLDVGIWSDEDWRALSIGAQWLYTAVLAHPKMPLVGVMDRHDRRWSQQATDATPETIAWYLDELRAARFVLVDDDTDEVMWRTFTAHDISLRTWNKNLSIGFWRQWETIESPILRAEVVHQAPDALWTRLEPHAPDSALQTRRSPRLEPETPPPSEPSVATKRPNIPSPSPSPVALHPSPSPDPSSSQTQSTTDPPTGDEAEAHPPTPDEIIDALTDRRLDELADSGRIRTSRQAIRPSIRSGIAADHHQAIHRAIRDHPQRTAAEHADALTRRSVPAEESRHPALLAQAARTDQPDGPPAPADVVADAKTRALAALDGSPTLRAVPDEEPS